MDDIMVDLETLGTVSDAVILSIGAVRFDHTSQKIDDDGFYASISIESNLAVGRRVQEDTLCWWMKQSPAAQRVFHEAKEPLESALTDFRDWADTGNRNTRIWSNGADFDIPMISHAFRTFGIEAPWKFWNTGCFRSWKNLPGAKAAPAPTGGVKHNALSDAVNQAVHLQAIYSALFGLKGKK